MTQPEKARIASSSSTISTTGCLPERGTASREGEEVCMRKRCRFSLRSRGAPVQTFRRYGAGALQKHAPHFAHTNDAVAEGQVHHDAVAASKRQRHLWQPRM